MEDLVKPPIGRRASSDKFIRRKGTPFPPGIPTNSEYSGKYRQFPILPKKKTSSLPICIYNLRYDVYEQPLTPKPALLASTINRLTEENGGGRNWRGLVSPALLLGFPAFFLLLLWSLG